MIGRGMAVAGGGVKFPISSLTCKRTVEPTGAEIRVCAQQDHHTENHLVSAIAGFLMVGQGEGLVATRNEPGSAGENETTREVARSGSLPRAVGPSSFWIETEVHPCPSDSDLDPPRADLPPSRAEAGHFPLAAKRYEAGERTTATFGVKRATQQAVARNFPCKDNCSSGSIR